MGEVCRGCGGKGWVWTGHARMWCGRCGGNGSRELPPDERRPHGPEAPDPAKRR